MNQEILYNLTAWADRHAEDPDDYSLGAFLTVGQLRELIKELKGDNAIGLLTAEYGYWRTVGGQWDSDKEGNVDMSQFATGAMGAVSNVLAGISKGMTPDQYRAWILGRDK